jgi:hypothetical protein
MLGSPGVLANDDTLLITWFESDYQLKVWDLRQSVVVKRIKSPVKSKLWKMVISGDNIYISHTPKNIISKFSLSEGKFISSYDGLCFIQ